MRVRKSSPVSEASRIAGVRSRVAEEVVWFIGAALSVSAAIGAMRFETPVDRALPVVVLFILGWSWCVRETGWMAAVQLAIPVVIACALLPLDTRIRLAAIGLATGFAFAAALLADREVTVRRAAFYIASAIVLLRWIPWADVRILRELLVLGGALAILWALRHTPGPIAISIAIVAALVTPAFPLRAIAVPYLVAVLVVIARVERVRAPLVGTAICAAVVALFPWSGIVARGLPFLLMRHGGDAPREEIRIALAPGESFDVWLPPHSQSLIVSGANVSRMRRGTVVGWIEPGHVALRIGDIADWGYMRRDHFFSSRNHLPRDPAGKIRDYGYSAWIDGAARIPLPVPTGTIRVSADPHLPAAARLQIESLEMAER